MSYENIEITLKLAEDINKLKQSDYKLILKFEPDSININDTTQEKLKQNIVFKEIDKQNLSFELPSKSTILLGGNYNSLHQFVGIKYSQDSTEKRIVFEMSELEKTGGLVPPFHFYYDIK